MVPTIRSRQRVVAPKPWKRTTGAQVRRMVLDSLTAGQGRDWADMVAHHVDNGGDFYVMLVLK